MGLRINTNIPAMQALFNLQVNEQSQSSVLQHLSTGLRINSGADDPAGLVISEQLRSQLSSLTQAVQNSQNAGNLIGVADGGLQQIANLLTQIQSSVNFAMNTSVTTSSQVAAQQSFVDQTIQAIDRIANTTRFSDQTLLNSNQGYIMTGKASVSAGIASGSPLNDINIQSVTFPQGITSRSLQISMITVPQRGEIRFSGTSTAAGTSGVTLAAVGATTLQVTGPRGTATIFLASSSFTAVPANTTSSIERAINGVADQTGVYASAQQGTAVSQITSLSLFSQDFGSAQTIQLSVKSGALAFRHRNGVFVTAAGTSLYSVATRLTTASGGLGNAISMSNPGVTPLTSANGANITDSGRDGQVNFQGTNVTGTGNKFTVQSPMAQLSFTLNPDNITSGIDTTGRIAALQNNDAFAPGKIGITITVNVQKSGLLFQLNSNPQSSDQLAFGIPSVNTSNLGSQTIRDRVAESLNKLSLPITTVINKGGFLNTLATGQANSLANNPQNAGSIVTAAINQVATLRGFIGAIQAQNIQPNTNALQTEIQNLSAYNSSIRDVDFAAATSQFTKTQILFQSGIAVLASANLIPQSVLTLLR